MKCRNCKCKGFLTDDDGKQFSWCHRYGDNLDKDEERYCSDYTPAINADRIRAMTDEELAEFFGTLPCCPPGEDLEELCFPLDSCEGIEMKVKCWLKWLRQEA